MPGPLLDARAWRDWDGARLEDADADADEFASCCVGVMTGFGDGLVLCEGALLKDRRCETTCVGWDDLSASLLLGEALMGSSIRLRLAADAETT